MSDSSALTSTKVLEVCSILITGLAAATGITRSFITVGEPAVDNTCGVLALSFMSHGYSRNFPNERWPQEDSQRPGMHLINLRVEAWRCVPVTADAVGEDPGEPPSVGTLTAAAAQVFSDDYNIQHYLDCALNQMYEPYTSPQTIMNYLIQGSTPLGPQGGMQGIAVNFTIGFNRECLC